MYSHRDLCVLAASWLLSQPWCDLTCWEMRYRKGVVDAIGISSSMRAKDRRVVAVEVKRTRADLLQDLRAQKLLKYERGSSHCYLAATPEALCLDKGKAHVLKDLTTKGLPKHWGILVLGEKPYVLRNPRRINTIQPATIAALNRKIAKSFCYRVLGDRFNSKLLGQL